MKTIIGLFLALTILNQGAFAANGSGNISNVLTLGGVNTSSGLNISEPNSQGYFTLYAGVNSSTNNNFYPFYKDGVAYQVTAGKTLKIVKICSVSSAAGTAWQIVSDSASFAYNASTLTSGLYQNGTANFYVMRNSSSTYTPICWDYTFSVAASRYLGVQEASSASTTSYYLLAKEI